MYKNEQGFSLIEVLIVMVIIGIISAIAVPNLLASRRAANEASAVSSMRALISAEHTYYTTAGQNINYGTLPQLGEVKLIDEVLQQATSAATPKSGFYFTASLTAGALSSPGSFVLAANPSVPAANGFSTGSLRFCSYHDGVVRLDTNSTGTVVTTIEQCNALIPMN